MVGSEGRGGVAVERAVHLVCSGENEGGGGYSTEGMYSISCMAVVV